MERSRVRLPAGSTFCSDFSVLTFISYTVSVSTFYRSGTYRTQAILPKVQVAGYSLIHMLSAYVASNKVTL